MTDFNATKALLGVKDEILSSAVMKKSTNEVVKFLNSKFPENIRFKAATVRASLSDLLRLGGVYKIYKSNNVLQIELFKNWNQLTMDQSKWFEKFANIVGSNKDVDTFSREARDRRQAARDNYDTKKTDDTKTSIELAMQKSPAFREMMARVNLFNYSDGEEGDTKESRRTLWIYDFYRKLEKDKDLLFMDMPNFRALTSRDYKGDYRMINDKVIVSEKELMAFFRELKLKPIIKRKGPDNWFEYPSAEELAQHGAKLGHVKKYTNRGLDDATSMKGLQNASLTTKSDNPKEYGFKGSEEDGNVLKVLVKEFWGVVQNGLERSSTDPVNMTVNQLQENIREMIYGQGDKIVKGQMPSHPELNKHKALVSLIKDYFTSGKFAKYKSVLQLRRDAVAQAIKDANKLAGN